MLFYFFHFGLTDDYKLISTLSNKMDIWGQLGDFFGGTTGTIISGLALLGVWKAYTLQNTQLQEMKLSGVREEFQRAINDSCNKIDLLLAQNNLLDNKHDIPNIGVALETLMKINISDNKDSMLFANDIESSLDNMSILYIFKEAEALCHVFDKYLEYGGNFDLYEIYKKKNEYCINGLHHVGIHNVQLACFDEYKDAISRHYPRILE